LFPMHCSVSAWLKFVRRSEIQVHYYLRRKYSAVAALLPETRCPAVILRGLR
jgi:hypothetical protein